MRVAAALALALHPVGCERTQELGSLELADLDGAMHRPLDVDGAKAHVVICMLPDCPIARAYAPEIAAIRRDYAAQPLRFFVAMPDADLAPAAARACAQELGIDGPILIDGEARLAAALGLTRSPEVAVVLPDGSVAYRGRIDDRNAARNKSRPGPARRDLRLALDSVLKGEPVEVARTEVVGCILADPPNSAGSGR